MLNRAITGHGVYGELPGNDGLLALRRILSTKPEVTPTLPAPLAEIVRDCLAPAPERPTAPVVAERLSAAAGAIA